MRRTILGMRLMLALSLATAVPVAVALAGAAPVAAATSTSSAYETELFRALSTCQSRIPAPQDPAVLSRCVEDLAPPSPKSEFEVDLFRAFSYCVWIASDTDSMYPGADPSEVNDCLEDFGF